MPAAPTRDSLLVDAGWLAGHLGDDDLRVVDIRGSIKPPTAPKPWYLPERAAWYEWEADPGNPVEKS